MRFNPTRESSNLFVPGLMAFVLTIISALMTALADAREGDRHDGGAARLAARPWQIIVGKVAPYLVIGFVSVLLVLVEARLVFHGLLRTYSRCRINAIESATRISEKPFCQIGDLIPSSLPARKANPPLINCMARSIVISLPTVISK